jgi:hypothetical protein
MKGCQYIFPFASNKPSITMIIAHLIAYSVIVWIFFQNAKEGFQTTTQTSTSTIPAVGESLPAVTPQPGLSTTQLGLIVGGIIIFAFYPPPK